MDISEHTNPSSLERYSFYWLLALLLFSALAMFLGARPPVTLVTGYSSTVWSLLNLSWLICGAAAMYLTYMWAQHNKELFGGKDTKDTVAFGFMLAAGYDLGLAGALGNNIFLNVVMGKALLIVTGVVCLVAAYHLHTRWKANGESLFAVVNGEKPKEEDGEAEKRETSNENSPEGEDSSG